MATSLALPFYRQRTQYCENMALAWEKKQPQFVATFGYVGLRHAGPALPWNYHLKQLWSQRHLWLDDDDAFEDDKVMYRFEHNVETTMQNFAAKFPWRPLGREYTELLKDRDSDLEYVGHFFNLHVAQCVGRFSLFPYMGPKGAYQLRVFLREALGSDLMMKVWLFLEVPSDDVYDMLGSLLVI